MTTTQTATTTKAPAAVVAKASAKASAKATTATTGRNAKAASTKATTKATTAPNTAPLPLCAGAVAQAAKPQRRMLAKITKINKHPGTALRIKRFHQYKVGMTLQHCKETVGLDYRDIGFYVDHGLMETTPATDKEYQAAVAAWEKAKAN